METPKEKAEKLVNRFITEGCLFANAIKCAKITAAEVIAEYPSSKEYWGHDDEIPSAVTFWSEVLTELNNYNK